MCRRGGTSVTDPLTPWLLTWPCGGPLTHLLPMCYYEVLCNFLFLCPSIYYLLSCLAASFICLLTWAILCIYFYSFSKTSGLAVLDDDNIKGTNERLNILPPTQQHQFVSWPRDPLFFSQRGCDWHGSLKSHHFFHPFIILYACSLFLEQGRIQEKGTMMRGLEREVSGDRGVFNFKMKCVTGRRQLPAVTSSKRGPG